MRPFDGCSHRVLHAAAVTSRAYCNACVVLLRRQCRVTAAEVAGWRAAKARLGVGCGRIADVSLLALERRQVYELAQFAEAQEMHRLQVLFTQRLCRHHVEPLCCGGPQHHGNFAQAAAALQEAHLEVASTVRDLHVLFAADSPAVQQEWLRYMNKVRIHMLCWCRRLTRHNAFSTT